MPRATTNKSMRLDEPRKEMRRRSVTDGETDEASRVAGATGERRRSAPRRPGRKAAIASTSQNTRSQRWRSPSIGSRSKRRGVLAKGSRTGRNRTKR